MIEINLREESIKQLAEKIFLQFCIDSKHDPDDYTGYLARRAIDYSKAFYTELDKYNGTQDYFEGMKVRFEPDNSNTGARLEADKAFIKEQEQRE